VKRAFLILSFFATLLRAGDTLEAGTLPARWTSGGPDCASAVDWEVHAYNPDFFVLRESGCINYEKPFLYLIFGEKKVLLEDTGAGAVKTAEFVSGLIDRWAKERKKERPQLVVIHSHGHGDHTAGDQDLRALPGVEFIAANPADIQKAAGIASWPAGSGTLDLGGRVIDVLPIPGHNNASIALYDRRTGILLTGDSLYPGRLYVNEPDLPVYADSAKRLADFVRMHPVSFVLGTHIEQTATPYLDYPRGTKYQPEEHLLQLNRAHVLELESAFQSRKPGAEPIILPDFTISIRAARPTR
jgi:hydroxyacylglutathione hydrolase